MDVNVNIEGLGTAASSIEGIFTAIDNALKAAETAGENAIAAVGGTGTRVGAAINDSFVGVNTTEFQKARNSVQNMLGNVGQVHTVYQQEEDDIVNAINTFKNGAAAE